MKVKEKAERDTRKNQSKIQKKNGKKSLIIVLSLQNTVSRSGNPHLIVTSLIR